MENTITKRISSLVFYAKRCFPWVFSLDLDTITTPGGSEVGRCIAFSRRLLAFCFDYPYGVLIDFFDNGLISILITSLRDFLEAILPLG